jgi:hypothetical protein
VHGRVAGGRNRQEVAERVAAAPDERLYVDLEDAGQRKGSERVDDFDALAAYRKVTQSVLRPSARSWL